MASEAFERAFSGYGSPCETCGFCGVTHFCPPSMGNCEDDEKWLKELLTNQAENPSKYQDHDYDGISHGYVAGVNYVVDCDCGKVDKYEDFIWEHRREIIRYIRQRLTEMHDDVCSELEDLEGVEP